MPPALAATSEVLQTFGGRMRSQVVCGRCQHKSNSYEPFVDVPLELIKCSSVAESLRKFTLAERLSGDNQYIQHGYEAAARSYLCVCVRLLVCRT